MGEPGGIGPEITVKAWLDRETAQLPPFFVIGPPALYAARARMLGVDLPIAEIDRPEAAATSFTAALPIMPIEAPEARAGTPLPGTAASVVDSISLAVELALGKDISALVTNPIHKAVLMEAGFEYPGHTDFLAAKASEALGEDVTALMLLAIPGLRVVPLVVHEPLSKVPALIQADSIVAAGHILAAALRIDFGITAPRIAVAGLNPHAGESGKLGKEEETQIAPAVEQLRREGIDATGPFASDSLFHEDARKAYDAALCMYHDQALIPLKTLSFHEGVNITLGLPFVRTSPDHGTALDIAAAGQADARSLCSALRTASQIADCRRAETATSP